MDMAQSAVLVGIIINIGAIALGIFKMGRAVEKFEQIGQQQAREISALKDNVEVVGELVTKLALQTQRQDSLEQRLDRHERIVDDMRRGEGFIFDLGRGGYYPPPKA